MEVWKGMTRTSGELDEALVLLLKVEISLQRPLAHFENCRICRGFSWGAVASMLRTQSYLCPFLPGGGD